MISPRTTTVISLTSQTQPTPARTAFSIVRDTETDPRWGWLGLACETILQYYHFTAHCKDPWLLAIVLMVADSITVDCNCRGIIDGERPYMSGTPCSDCPSNMTICVEDLCCKCSVHTRLQPPSIYHLSMHAVHIYTNLQQLSPLQ